ncbi:hypothetical protein L3X38_018304 [Prunus dulcis]|uniref:Uncharacterized protein n=1 Tax=Prunus dulcis TaxID=3755 RepID=A0AAD4WBH7_PRUDU|nr:hypothetical protein L3X38_018304 [Prunus dulcis]
MQGPTSTSLPRSWHWIQLETHSPDVGTRANCILPGRDCGCQFPLHDPLVITAEITHCEVAWVFVDGGSSVNIIFLSAFKQLGVSENLLTNVALHSSPSVEDMCNPLATCP